MPINAGLMSSLTPEWETPRDLFQALSLSVGPFDLDVCATAENTKCARFYSPTDDGLSDRAPWEGRCWMNPPYGREIGLWVRKAAESAVGNGATVVCLVPARTDTRWWQNWVERENPEKGKDPIRHPWVRSVSYLAGRVRFGGAGPAPFPSAVVVMGPSGIKGEP